MAGLEGKVQGLIMIDLDTQADPLREEQLAQFRRDGYVRIKAAFSKNIAKDCENTILSILEQEHGVNIKAPGKARFILKRRANTVFDKMITPKLANVLDRLFGSEGWDRRHFATHGEFFVTFPGFLKGSRNPLRLVGRWHVDLGFQVVPAHDITDRNCAFVPAFLVTESKQDGACTLVAAGSHKVVAKLLGSVRKPIPRQEMVAFCEGYVSRGAGQETIVQLIGEAGDVFVLHPLLMHAASANGRDIVRIMGNTGIGGIGKRKVGADDADRSISDEIIWQEIKSIRRRPYHEYLLKAALSLNRYFWALRYRVHDKWKAVGEPKGADEASLPDWRTIPHLLLNPICAVTTSAIFRLMAR